MTSVQKGFQEAVEGVVVGFVIQIFIIVFQKIPIIPSTYVLSLQLIQIVGLIGDIILIATMQYRGFGFFVGWVFGMGIMAYAGLVETWLIVLYIVVGIITIFAKVWSNSRTSRYGDYY